jgi:pimeloyl-ACP methyl ester carboxylesterase
LTRSLGASYLVAHMQEGYGVTRRAALRGLGSAAGIAALAPGAAIGSERVQRSLSVKALDRRLRSRYARNGRVRLHYEIAGRGPLILFVHGFPGWWWTWRHVMAPLAGRFTVAAMDTRGYNQSDKPAGVANYDPVTLAGDLGAVIKHAGHRSATVVGHDWGGALAWVLGFIQPRLVDRLVILNIPHPWALAHQLAVDPTQRAASRYAREFQRPDALQHPFPEQLGGGPFTAETVARILAPVGSPDYPRHLKAMRRTSLQAALNYYRAGYPAEPYVDPAVDPPKVQAPTLVIYGRDDPVLLVDGLNRTWDFVARSVEIRVIPHAGHFVHNDALPTVNQAIGEWLERTPARSH